ncbi:MAG: hypothetical protein CMLOHMNK_01670 [Steroidobacteraceae bacterium]|nr:hypothetical protein [Steroidobacteraceae bacterium]
MNIWLVTVGEPLPLPGESARLWRCGLLARTLATRSHKVTWWTSTFDHSRKLPFSRPTKGKDDVVLGGVCLRWLDGIAYRRNLSLRRIVNHVQLGMRFFKLARTCNPRPDVIVASFPTIELAYVASLYARRWNCPLIVDVRDLWPDIFVDAVPPVLRGPARLLLSPYFSATRFLLGAATSVVAVSQKYLDWGIERAGRPTRSTDRVFPLGYEPTTPTEQDRLEIDEVLRQADEMHIAVFAGSFGRTYDLATVIEAARLMDGRGDSSPLFVLCGTGEKEHALRQLAAGLSNVVFTGLLSAGKLAAVFERASIGLAAYAVDAPQGIPNKVVEYSCAGLSIMSSLEGETKTLLDESGCGLSYAAGNPHDLRRVLVSLLADPAGMARMRGKASETYRNRFAAIDVYAAMADHVERVARLDGNGETEKLA